MTTPQIQVINEAIRCELGEGPHWNSKEQVLYYVDIEKGRVLRYDPNKRLCHYVTVSTALVILMTYIFLQIF